MEGLAELVVTRLIIGNGIKKIKILRMIFFLDHLYKLNSDLECKYEKLLDRNSRYSIGEISHEKSKTFAAAIFLQNAQPDHIKWVLHHYSVHILASEFTAILIFLTVVAPLLQYFGLDINTLPRSWYIAGALLIYPLIYIAADRERYTYEAAFRQAILALSDEAETVEQKSINQAKSKVDNSTSLSGYATHKVTGRSGGRSRHK